MEHMPSIARHVQLCFNSFHDARADLAKAEDTIRYKMQPWNINDEMGRFRLWCGNVAAHRTGRSSLDYRLREASHIRDRVVELLKNLESVIQEAKEIISGGRIPWEDVSDSESDSSSEEGFEEPNTTELQQLMSNVAEITTCLMRLSMAIRNPAPHDQFKESAEIDMSYFEAFDIDHVRSKFPQAEEFLVLRLGKAISRRRQYLRYRDEHQKKLKDGLEGAVNILEIQTAGAVIAQAPSVRFESTVASSIPMALKVPALMTHIDDTDYYEDALSQTSYASSMTDDKKLRPPPLPEQGQDGNPFECPLCFRFTSIRHASAWHKHVYRDLQPYVCSFEGCEIPDASYESRHDWFNHEDLAHRAWWECLDGCNMEFATKVTFRKHLEEDHPDLLNEGRVEDLMRSCERHATADTKAECPLCLQASPSLAQLRRHLGKHHEELSLFALPPSLKGHEDGNEEDPSDHDTNALSLKASSDGLGSMPSRNPSMGSHQDLLVGIANNNAAIATESISSDVPRRTGNAGELSSQKKTAHEDMIMHTFTWHDLNATDVFVSGDFESGRAVRLQRSYYEFEGTVAVPCRDQYYRFEVDDKDRPYNGLHAKYIRLLPMSLGYEDYLTASSSEFPTTIPVPPDASLQEKPIVAFVLWRSEPMFQALLKFFPDRIEIHPRAGSSPHKRHVALFFNSLVQVQVDESTGISFEGFTVLNITVFETNPIPRCRIQLYSHRDADRLFNYLRNKLTEVDTGIVDGEKHSEISADEHGINRATTLPSDPQQHAFGREGGPGDGELSDQIHLGKSDVDTTVSDSKRLQDRPNETPDLHSLHSDLDFSYTPHNISPNDTSADEQSIEDELRAHRERWDAIDIANSRPQPKDLSLRIGDVKAKLFSEEELATHAPNEALLRGLIINRAGQQHTVHLPSFVSPRVTVPPPSGLDQSHNADNLSQGNVSEDEADSSEDGILYCMCRKPDNHKLMLKCNGGCEDWYHGACMNITPAQKDLIDEFICPNCEVAGRGETKWKEIPQEAYQGLTAEQETQKENLSGQRRSDRAQIVSSTDEAWRTIEEALARDTASSVAEDERSYTAASQDEGSSEGNEEYAIDQFGHFVLDDAGHRVPYRDFRSQRLRDVSPGPVLLRRRKSATQIGAPVGAIPEDNSAQASTNQEASATEQTLQEHENIMDKLGNSMNDIQKGFEEALTPRDPSVSQVCSSDLREKLDGEEEVQEDVPIFCPRCRERRIDESLKCPKCGIISRRVPIPTDSGSIADTTQRLAKSAVVENESDEDSVGETPVRGIVDQFPIIDEFERPRHGPDLNDERRFVVVSDPSADDEVNVSSLREQKPQPNERKPQPYSFSSETLTERTPTYKEEQEEPNAESLQAAHRGEALPSPDPLAPTSGSENMESRASRIKARVAELTENT